MSVLYVQVQETALVQREGEPVIVDLEEEFFVVCNSAFDSLTTIKVFPRGTMRNNVRDGTDEWLSLVLSYLWRVALEYWEKG